MTRPDYEIEFNHVTDAIRENVVDLRLQSAKCQVQSSTEKHETLNLKPETKIYITDSIFIDVSATEIRQKITDGESDWRELVPEEVAKYVKKYNLYI